jgi:hypothetical protein
LVVPAGDDLAESRVVVREIGVLPAAKVTIFVEGPIALVFSPPR